MDRKGSGVGFLAGLLIGGLAGGSLALALAPRRTQDMRERITELANDLQASTNEIYARGRKLVDDARSNIGAAVEEGSAAANDMRRELDRGTTL